MMANVCSAVALLSEKKQELDAVEASIQEDEEKLAQLHRRCGVFLSVLQFCFLRLRNFPNV